MAVRPKKFTNTDTKPKILVYSEAETKRDTHAVVFSPFLTFCARQRGRQTKLVLLGRPRHILTESSRCVPFPKLVTMQGHHGIPLARMQPREWALGDSGNGRGCFGNISAGCTWLTSVYCTFDNTGGVL